MVGVIVNTSPLFFPLIALDPLIVLYTAVEVIADRTSYQCTFCKPSLVNFAELAQITNLTNRETEWTVDFLLSIAACTVGNGRSI